ncbi:hypothetical protein [Microbacterium elymi]|uniref:Uncharacterized protein n=1 Tax=Microbacterium elymi TaxID=2909587 RepID=A0ABY5NMM3_9MICO|nr:hypothetical protein [Microbacterium elymi]UUT36383.1 hypothetical protein L2X98_25985 [Microbacterium elymi]
MDDREFGRLVRQWRDRVEPAAVGMPAGAHRRALGLAPRRAGASWRASRWTT